MSLRSSSMFEASSRRKPGPGDWVPATACAGVNQVSRRDYVDTQSDIYHFECGNVGDGLLKGNSIISFATLDHLPMLFRIVSHTPPRYS